MYFDKQEFMVMHKCPAYYASIMLNAFKHLLCQHNRQVPRCGPIHGYIVNSSHKREREMIITAFFCLPSSLVHHINMYDTLSFYTLDDISSAAECNMCQ